MSTANTRARVDLTVDKVSTKSRVDRSNIAFAMASTTDLYQKDPAFKDSIDKLAKAGADLAASDDQVTHLEAELVKARGIRDANRNTYDKAHSACAANVEIHSVLPKDVQGYGFSVLEKSPSALVPPSDIALKYDIAKGVLRIRVVCASRIRRFAIEISPDPAGPATFTRLEGTGAIRALHGYAPGTYWVRAATLAATAQSDWFGPVPVIVK